MRKAGGDAREALREHPLHGHGDHLLVFFSFFFAANKLMCESKVPPPVRGAMQWRTRSVEVRQQC